eukprot:9484370-Pyramimonas_sp.AAC.1
MFQCDSTPCASLDQGYITSRPRRPSPSRQSSHRRTRYGWISWTPLVVLRWQRFLCKGSVGPDQDGAHVRQCSVTCEGSGRWFGPSPLRRKRCRLPAQGQLKVIQGRNSARNGPSQVYSITGT